MSRSREPDVRVAALTVRSPRGEAVPALRFEPRELGAPVGTALLAHGITASKETLFVLGEALARAGFVCLAVDLPGHGASRTALDAAAVRDAFAAGVAALRGAPRARSGAVDVLVGHSFGAGTAALAIEAGVLAPRLFVAIGSLPRRTSAGRTLLIAGAQEELLSPAELRAHAEQLGAEAVVVPLCEHALEPFHPGVVEATVTAACATVGVTPPARAPWRWAARLAGALLAIAAALLALHASLPAAPPSTRFALALGLGAGATVDVALSAALHGQWLFLLPTPGRAGLALALSVGAFLASLAAGAGLARLTSWRDLWRAAPAGQALLLGLAALLALGLGALGARFVALIAALVALLLGLGAAFGFAVGRQTGSATATHAAFASLVGYVPGLWFGGFLEV